MFDVIDLASRRVRVVRVIGDGMEPTLRPRLDFALCRPVHSYQGEGIYLLSGELGGETFYRVDALCGRVRLLLDNPLYRGGDALHLPHANVPVEIGDLLGRSPFALVVVHHAALPLLMSAASQGGRRKRATGGGDRTTAGGGSPDAVAVELRDLVHQAAGDAAGKTVAAQVRQAARHLGYPAESWRVREAWYGRAGSWSAAAVDDLRRRFMAWRDGGRGRAGSDVLVRRIHELRAGLAQIDRDLAVLEGEVARLSGADERGGGSDA